MALIQLSYGFDDRRIVKTDRCERGVSAHDTVGSGGAGFESWPRYLIEMHASIRRAAEGEFADAERERIGGAASSFLSGARGFAVRTISGEIVGELVEVVPSTSTGGLEVVIVKGLLGRRRRLPAELVLGANATERVIILNLGTASALDQLGSRSTAKAPSRRGQRLDDPASTHLCFLPADRGYDLVVRLAALPPASQATIEVKGHRYSIAKIGRSPLPDDPRPCLYLVAEPSRADQTFRSPPR